MSRESEIIQRAAAEFIHDRHRLGAFVGGLLVKSLSGVTITSTSMTAA